MARRSYRRSAPKRRYSSSGYSRSPRRRSYSSGRRRSGGGGGQTLRLVLQNPGMQAQRPAFGTFMPSFMPAFMQQNPQLQQQGFPPGGMGESVTLPGAPTVAQGGPGIPGARMVINRLGRDPSAVYVPPGYRLVREEEPDTDPTQPEGV